MQQQESNTRKDPFFLNVRKLAALDIVFHGPRKILIEFLFTVGLGCVLTILSLSYFVRTHPHPFFALILSLIFLGIALNYLPLLFYTLRFIRHKNARSAVEPELAHKEQYARKYQIQSFLLFIPFVVFALAIIQERAKHS